MSFRYIHTYNLYAFLAVLVVILVLSLFGQKDLAVITGLVGILGSFKPWGSAPTDKHGPAGTPADPIAVAGATNAPSVKVEETGNE